MRNKNTYTFIFAAIVCFICSLLLSLVSGGLKSKQVLNEELDIKKNILKAVSLETPLPAKASAQQILDVYNSKIDELVLDASGQVIKGKKPSDYDLSKADVSPLYVYKEGARIKAYAYPIQGKGLWSTLYGYLAIEPDGKTVRGITFYKHGETPGLGAEIEQPWFQNNFKGKTIWTNGQLTPIAVVKGKVADKFSDERANYHVDGISGATLTSKGVTNLLDVNVRKYEPFFKAIRK